MITLNEGHNMAAVLENLRGWAQEVFIVDSYSKDDTVDIALKHGAHVVQRQFRGFGDQWNFAMSQLPITAPWTMKLDPDERLTDALKHNALVNKPAIIRPWLQAHDATWLGAGRYIHYGPAQIREQIDAARALGIDEYMLWDASNKNYPREAFFSEAEAERRYEKARQERESKGHDLLGRTARKAAEAYLEALAKLDWMEAYPLQQGFKGGYGAYRDWLLNVPGRVKEWRIGGVDNNGNKAGISLSVTLTLDGEEISLDDEKWSMLKENNVWRVKPSSRFLEIISGESEASKGQEQ